MRILLVTHRFLPRYLAGTEVYTGHLAGGLQLAGHDVELFTGDPAATAAYAYAWKGLAVQAVPWRQGKQSNPVSTFLASFRNQPVERRFAEVCADFRPEIVHFQHLMGLSSRLPAISRRYGARIVVTLHDYWFQCSNTWLFRYSNEPCAGPGLGFHCGGCAAHRLGRKPHPMWMALAAPLFVLRTALLRRVLRSADRLICPSRLTASMFASDHHLANKISIVPHGLPKTASPSSDRAASTRPMRYVYLGPVIRPKGLHIIVNAFEALQLVGAELHVYGDLLADATYVDELRRIPTRPGLDFKGPLARHLVPGVLREADLLLVPTLMRETYSVVVDEAFAAGLPVLVSSTCAAAERVIAGINGLVAPPGDVEAWRIQMDRIGVEPRLLARLRAGIQPPSTMQAHTQTIASLYRKVLQEII